MIPLVDLRIQYASLRGAIDAAITEVCASGSFILGPQVAEFEAQFARCMGVNEAVGVANGTDALRLVCEAIGIGPGDEVLIPANTFVATAVAVHQAGATPVPVDVDPATYLIDLEDAVRHISPKTRALMPVHLYGRALDMDAVLAFTDAHGLLLIEDACQAHGAQWRGRRVGGFGAAGCFSFYPAKNLGGFGDGGMIVTNDAVLAEKLRLMRNYGSVRKYEHELAAGNSRLDAIQAAVLNVKLPHLDEWNAARFHAACRYAERLVDLPGVTLPQFDRRQPDCHVFHLFVIQSGRRDDLVDYLGKRGIQTGIHYPITIHRHRAFAHLGYGPGSFPVAEALASRILSLPIYPEITEKDIDFVADAIREFHA